MRLSWFQLQRKAQLLRSQGVRVTVRGHLLVIQGERPPLPFLLRPPRFRRSSKRQVMARKSSPSPTVVSFPRMTLP